MVDCHVRIPTDLKLSLVGWSNLKLNQFFTFRFVDGDLATAVGNSRRVETLLTTVEDECAVLQKGGGFSGALANRLPSRSLADEKTYVREVL